MLFMRMIVGEYVRPADVLYQQARFGGPGKARISAPVGSIRHSSNDLSAHRIPLVQPAIVPLKKTKAIEPTKYFPKNRAMY
jgi:hypothetical protein